MAPPQPSRTYGGRFQIEEEAGRGGMATIYAAHDLTTGGRVALKILRDEEGVSGERFRQEAGLLAELRHPAIVRYIDHGMTASGEHFIAMEWLEGETLEQRLESGPIGVQATLRLATRVLEALAFAHDKGVIHRDLKPSNLFLPARSLKDVKLLDFGIARRQRSRRMTKTGSALGTPMYMSPEQARGDAAFDGRSDLFSLGAMLVECLTGTSPFEAETAVAVMVKICLEPLDLPALCRGAPEAMVDLLSQMLAKKPEQRPARADALASEFSKIEAARASDDDDEDRPPPDLTPRPELTIEQRIVSAIVVWPPAGAAPDVTGEDVSYGAVAGVIEEFSARVDRFAGGAMLVTVSGQGTPTDQAARAARCALRLQTLLPRAVFAVSTGRAMVGDDLPMGDVVDRAAVLLRKQEPGTIVVDLPTTALLERTFQIAPALEGGRLLFERPHADAPHALPGGEQPCLGRERELATLLAIFDECLAEPVARAVIVTAPAGGGKSRVYRELMLRAQNRGQQFDVLVGRGNSIRAGAPFALLGFALRAAAGIGETEPLPSQRDRLLAMVARHFPPDVAPRIAAFLGEMAHVPFADDGLPVLRHAREDPRVMADQMLAAWLDWIEAECKRGPVLLVLEDLHWGDFPSVEFVDAALRTVANHPLMVVALSRPDVADRFPGLWAERDLQWISLPPLTPKSCQKLIQQLVPGLDAKKAQWIVERADGNAFYLEELVRAVADGIDSENLSSLPVTILGTVQARFDALGKYVRRVLRVASVFGETFSADGVTALVEDTDSVEPALEVLEGKEIVLARPGSGDRQFAFRHALLRDAAYEMLTEDDRRLAHGRAGEFLESRGERNAIVLVEHFERGGAFARAVRHCERAAAQALEANDLKSAIERVARGIRSGAEGETRGGLRLIEAQARLWSGEYADDEVAAREAVTLTRGPVRLHALSELVGALGQQGRFAEIESLLTEARGWPKESDQLAAWYLVLLRATGYLPSGGMLELTEDILSEVERCAPLSDPSIRGRLHNSRGLLGLGTAQLAGAALHCREAIAAFEAAGDFRGALEARCNLVAVVGTGGKLDEAERDLRELLAISDRMNFAYLEVTLLQNLGVVRADLGALEEAQAILERALAAARRQGDRRKESGCLQSLAVVATRAGQFAAAETLARDSVATSVTSLQPLAIATLAGALLGLRRVPEALAKAQEANSILEAQGYVEDGEALVRLSLIECLLAAGDTAAARHAAERAYRRLLERAAAIDEPQWRATFLNSMPDHRRTMELAGTLGLEAA